MIELLILNKQNKEVFSKFFDSPYQADEFKNKIKHSNKLRLVGEFRNV